MESDQTVTASYRWTADELITAQSYHFRISLRGLWRGPGAIITVMLVASAVVFVIQGASPFGVVLSLAILGGVFWLAMRFLSPWFMRRHFAKRPDRDKIVHYSVDASSIRSKVEGFAEGKQSWDALTKVVQTPKGFLFYLHERMFVWIPNHALGSQEEIDQLGRLAQQHAPEFLAVT